jgi:hypothetical protein
MEQNSTMQSEAAGKKKQADAGGPCDGRERITIIVFI